MRANEPARRTLQLLIDEVGGCGHSRAFLLDRDVSARDVIATLNDARLLHVLRRGIVDPRKPGQLYDGFAIDFGCCVALLADGQPRLGPRGRAGWLSSTRIPPEDFTLTELVVDPSSIRDE